MRYTALEKLEIIGLVEQSALSVRQVLGKIGIPCSTFHRWCDLYRTGGPEALADRTSGPNQVTSSAPPKDHNQMGQSRRYFMPADVPPGNVSI